MEVDPVNQMYHLTDVNRIQTTLYWLDSNYSLTFTVSTNRKTKTDETKYFYKEYNSRNGLNIYLELYYYMEIASMPIDGVRNTFRVIDSGSKANYYQFVSAIKTIMTWLTTDIGKDLYMIMPSGIIQVNNKFTALKVAGPFNGIIEFMPSVMSIGTNSEQVAGINIFINDYAEPIFMDRISFLNFAYFISNFNMINAAMSMINFLGRPDVSEDSDTRPQSNNYGFLNKVGAKKRE